MKTEIANAARIPISGLALPAVAEGTGRCTLAWMTQQPVAIAERPPPRQPSRTFRRTMSRSAKIPIQKFEVLAILRLLARLSRFPEPCRRRQTGHWVAAWLLISPHAHSYGSTLRLDLVQCARPASMGTRQCDRATFKQNPLPVNKTEF